DVTVGQVQRVGHSRLDPDCTSTDYGRCRDRLAETLRPYHFSGLHVERAEDAGLASENNKVARNGGRRGYTQLGSVLPTNGPVHRVDRVEEIVERAHKQRFFRNGWRAVDAVSGGRLPENVTGFGLHSVHSPVAGTSQVLVPLLESIAYNVPPSQLTRTCPEFSEGVEWIGAVVLNRHRTLPVRVSSAFRKPAREET